MRKYIFALFICFLAVTQVSAGTVNLAWDAPTSIPAGVTITGYEIDYGTATGTYSQSMTVGNVLTATVPNLTAGTTYFFVAKTLGSNGAKSGPSNEVSALIPFVTYTLTASSGSNGSVTPSGVTTVNTGTNKVYTITPNAGYAVADVLVDGASVGAVTTYNFTNVIANHTISATFTAIVPPAPTLHLISAVALGGGSITPSGNTSVSDGGSLVYTIKPFLFHKLAKLTVDGVNVPITNIYTFKNVKANHSIQAQFAFSFFGADQIEN